MSTQRNTVLPGGPGLRAPHHPAALLHCPIRGPLNVLALAKDGLTATEEARRIDFLRFLLERDYPEQNIAVETLIIKELGESGRNKLRSDVIVYNSATNELQDLPLADRLKRAILVAEIKRDSKKAAYCVVPGAPISSGLSDFEA